MLGVQRALLSNRRPAVAAPTTWVPNAADFDWVLMPDATLVNSGADVASWTSAGAVINALTPTGGAQPYSANVFNGLKGVAFNGTGGLTDTGSSTFPAGAEFQQVVLFQIPSLAAGSCVLSLGPGWSGTAGFGLIVGTNGVLSVYGDGYDAGQQPTFTTNAGYIPDDALPHVLYVAAGSVDFTRLDGVDNSTFSGNDAGAFPGQSGVGFGVSGYHKMAAYLCGTDVVGTEIEKAEGELAYLAGIILGGGHPYAGGVRPPPT